jgi:hypothetical protein
VSSGPLVEGFIANQCRYKARLQLLKVSSEGENGTGSAFTCVRVHTGRGDCRKSVSIFF